jgi:hypothetical protein
LPDDPNKRALVEYYNIFERAKRPSGAIDWDMVHQFEGELRAKWTPTESDYVDRNIGLTEWGPLMQEYITAQRELSDSGYWDVPETDRRVFRFENPGAEEALTGKFYNYKPIEGEAEKISLKWQDVYRRIDGMKDTIKNMSDKLINEEAPPEGISSEKWEGMNPSDKRDALVDAHRERITNENPGFFEDDKRRDAWNKGFGEDGKESLIKQYVDRAEIVRITSPSSIHTKLFMLKHKDLLDKGLALDEWTEDYSDESFDALELRVRHFDKTTIYEDIDPTAKNPDTDEFLRVEFQQGNPIWWDDQRRIKVYEMGVGRPEALKFVDTFVEYGHKADEHGANSAEAMLFRFKNEGFNALGLKEGTFSDEGWQPIEEEKVPQWEIKVDFAKEFEERQDILNQYEGDIQTQKIDEYFASHSEFHRKFYELQALEANFPTAYKDGKGDPMKDYVEWYVRGEFKPPQDWYETTGTDKWYEDDWFLMEHQDFYQAMRKAEVFTERRNFLKVPTRGVYEKYLEYLNLETSQSRMLFRWNNRDLDRWGNKKGQDALNWVPIHELWDYAGIPKGKFPKNIGAEEAEKMKKELNDQLEEERRAQRRETQKVISDIGRLLK